jgi:hypothetical protein
MRKSSINTMLEDCLTLQVEIFFKKSKIGLFYLESLNLWILLIASESNTNSSVSTGVDRYWKYQCY